MSLRINHNIQALNAHRSLTATSERVAKSMERLSSGVRINRGGDDAAGLGISERMRSQIRGLAQAQRNTQDGVSLIQTAEGSLSEVHSMLQRVRELAVQYKNGTLAADDRTAIQAEVDQLKNEVERIGQQASFNGIDLLNQNVMITFQVGANDGETISVATISLSGQIGTAAYALTSGSNADLSEIDAAISMLSNLRATFGAAQNRFEHTLSALGAYQENLVAAESRIRDVDMAEEMVKLTKDNILAQAGQSMLAQANQAPQSILNLLRG